MGDDDVAIVGCHPRAGRYIDPRRVAQVRGRGGIWSDTPALGAGGREPVGVRIPPPASLAREARAHAGGMGATLGGGRGATDRSSLPAGVSMQSRRTDVPFEEMLAGLPDPVLLFEPERDAEGRVVDFRIAYRNPAAARVSGVPDEHLLGRRLRESVRRHDDTDPIARFAEVLATGEPSTKGAQRLDLELGGSGRLAGIYESQAVKVGDAVMLTYRDVTEPAAARREPRA